MPVSAFIAAVTFFAPRVAMASETLCCYLQDYTTCTSDGQVCSSCVYQSGQEDCLNEPPGLPRGITFSVFDASGQGSANLVASAVAPFHGICFTNDNNMPTGPCYAVVGTGGAAEEDTSITQIFVGAGIASAYAYSTACYLPPNTSQPRTSVTTYGGYSCLTPTPWTATAKGPSTALTPVPDLEYRPILTTGKAAYYVGDNPLLGITRGHANTLISWGGLFLNDQPYQVTDSAGRLTPPGSPVPFPAWRTQDIGSYQAFAVINGIQSNMVSLSVAAAPAAPAVPGPFLGALATLLGAFGFMACRRVKA